MGRQEWFAELRTILTGLDPGLARLRLAATGTAAMALAAALMSIVRAVTGEPVTLVLFAAVLAMVSNLSATDPDAARRRGTIALMLLPAAAATTAGTLLAPQRFVADAVFVVVMVAAVYVRRFGPRGFALGMAMFMPFFFTQFLQAQIAQLPWLLLAAAVGIGSTLLLRGVVFSERPERTLERQLRAFRAHVHALVESVEDLLTELAGAHGDGGGDRALDRAVDAVRRRQARLNDTALLVADSVDRLDDASRSEKDGTERSEKDGTERSEKDGTERSEKDGTERSGRDGTEPSARDGAAAGRDGGRGPAGNVGERALHVGDAELAAERLAVSSRRLAGAGTRLDAETAAALRAGLRGLLAATATGTPPAMTGALLDEARRAVAGLTGAVRGAGDRAQRVALAVDRLATALADLDAICGNATATENGAPPGVAPAADEEPADGRAGGAGAVEPDRDGEEKMGGLLLTTRQAVQVGVATSVAIVVGDLVSPARWYWAVITAFVVFAGTSSRGDVLSRGGQRILGTVGGVAAGMALAVAVSGRQLLALLLLFVCAFLALYLVRVSQAFLAFWITAVLALLYGLIGQFSVETLVVRIEETVVGALIGMLAGYLVLPKRTREAFEEALDALVDDVDALLVAATDQFLGRPPRQSTAELSRQVHDGLATLRARSVPLDSPLPWRRGRSSYHRALRVLTAVDYYARSLARLSDTVHAPAWTALDAAADRVRGNLDALRRALLHRDPGEVRSAEEVVDAAEAAAAHHDDAHRAALLSASRLLRRIDQAVLRLAADIGVPGAADPGLPAAGSAERTASAGHPGPG